MILLLLVSFIFAGTRAEPLGTYNVDRNGISVSGISSGACMASQVHVAYSSVFMGVGMVAGAPYYCAEGSTLRALRCMDSPSTIVPSILIDETLYYQGSGRVDPTSNMLSSKVFIFQGSLDTVVNPAVGQHVETYYKNFVHNFNIRTEFSLNAEHGFPTEDIGSACNVLDPEYINRCFYNGAFEMLNHFYGGLQAPVGPVALTGDLYLFDQSEFFYISFPSQSNMDSQGYVYVPSRCKNGIRTCKLHVVLHGCQQGRSVIGDSFVMKTGYNEVGELNDIIMIYPQAIKNVMNNPQGCWDWWGYNNYLYATKDGNQVLAIYRMVEKAAAL